ncbi:WD40 domain-containing protein [Ceratobasidium sp. AG-Ba]|nr:WD40 domain-containing protein [Ceratobasidium sp. AG-Ba]
MSTMSVSYNPSWKIVNEQQNLLTSLAISLDGARLVVASKDCNMLLIDMEDGSVLANLSFENRFWATSTKWYSSRNLFVGGSNGVIYQVCFNPTNHKFTATMNPILELQEQIWSLEFDPGQNLLAAGHRDRVGLYTYHERVKNSEPQWKSVENIKGPHNDERGLVTALLFYPTRQNERDLFIGYAEAGWSIWSRPGCLKRVSPDHNHNVCRIGSVTLSPDKKSIAISALDRCIITYELSDGGPLLESMKEHPYEDISGTCPIVPIAFTSDGVIIGGTACGDVPMINDGGVTTLIHHERPNHVIRAIATFGQKIIVGSSAGSETVLTCYAPSVVVAVKPQKTKTSLITASDALVGWEERDIP